MNYCIYGAASDTIDQVFLRAGEHLGRALALRGHGMVFGGGAAGMMGAAARAMCAVNEAIRTGSETEAMAPDQTGPAPHPVDIIGVAPRFFDIDGVLFPGCTQMIYTETMRERKQTMEKHADGFIVLPGGIGTMDEFFEILTLKQLGLHGKPIAILNVNGYYDPLAQLLQQMSDGHFMKPASLTLYRIFTDPEELTAWLEKQKEVKIDLASMREANWTLRK